MIHIGKTHGWGRCVVYKTNPLHTSPFWLNIVLNVSKLTIIQHTHTTQLYFADKNYPWPFYLFSQSQQSLTKCNLYCFVLKVRNCHFISLIVLVPQSMLKWSKRVSLRSVSFTNYPTLHHPLLSTFLFFSFLFFFSCLQILHITKYYNIPRIQNQIYLKFQLCKYTQKLYTVEYSRNIARCSTISLVINNSLVIKFWVCYFQWW